MIRKRYTNLVNDAEFERRLKNDISSILDDECRTTDEKFRELKSLICDYIDSFADKYLNK